MALRITGERSAGRDDDLPDRQRADATATRVQAAVRRSIGAAVIDDDHLVRNFRRRDSANHIGNWFFFI